jgi:membrane-associated phospholipid phosphatase
MHVVVHVEHTSWSLLIHNPHTGHTSWSFASMVFLTLYFYYFTKPAGVLLTAVDLVVVFFPTLLAAWVGMTRVIDNYHNPSDVLAGGLLGTAIAVATFYSYFPGGKLAKLIESGTSMSGRPPVELLPI